MKQQQKQKVTELVEVHNWNGVMLIFFSSYTTIPQQLHAAFCYKILKACNLQGSTIVDFQSHFFIFEADFWSLILNWMIR